MVRKETPEPGHHTSWGSAAGLLAGCGVTLIGIAMGLPPNLIVARAMGGACIVAVMASLLALGWQLVTPQREDDS